jgi:hypothetical protein
MTKSPRCLQVFLNYASADKPMVEDLYDSLKDSGVDVWFDRKSLIAGQRWRDEISKAIRKSDIVIVCLSKKAIDKDGYVQKEIKFALDKADEKPEGKIYVIPVGLEKCNTPDRLAEYQWVDLFEDDGFEILMYSLYSYAQNLKLSLPLLKLEDQTNAKKMSTFVEKRLAKVELVKSRKDHSS